MYMRSDLNEVTKCMTSMSDAHLVIIMVVCPA
jgi:hypothetical protein